MDNKNKKETYAKITKEQHQKAEGQKNITKEITKPELYKKENFSKITKEQHQKMRRDSKENAKKEHKS